jgi:hypothetical protein
MARYAAIGGRADKPDPKPRRLYSFDVPYGASSWLAKVIIHHLRDETKCFWFWIDYSAQNRCIRRLNILKREFKKVYIGGLSTLIGRLTIHLGMNYTVILNKITRIYLIKMNFELLELDVRRNSHVNGDGNVRPSHLFMR